MDGWNFPFVGVQGPRKQGCEEGRYGIRPTVYALFFSDMLQMRYIKLGYYLI